MNRLLAAGLLLAAPALAEIAPLDDGRPFSVALEPKGMHEECLRIEEGVARRYHCKSEVPVEFNIHDHRGKEVFYPVKREGMRGEGASFVAKSAEDYCWMWTARTPAKIERRIALR